MNLDSPHQTHEHPTEFDQRLAATQAILARIAHELTPAVFATSLAAEDMVLTDLILRAGLPIGIFTLETGRLPPQTLDMLDKIKQHYGFEVELYFPNPVAVADYVGQNGLDGFFESVDLRKQCCQIRKVEPLGRALVGKRAWITGQRRSQSSTRSNLDVEEHDAIHGLVKFNPLADWSEQDVWHYLHRQKVPYNALHDAGYPSIGCAPCTRAVQPGEDIRAGRWWWENPENKECGLHVVDGKLIRINKAN